MYQPIQILLTHFASIIVKVNGFDSTWVPHRDVPACSYFADALVITPLVRLHDVGVLHFLISIYLAASVSHTVLAGNYKCRWGINYGPFCHNI